MRSLIPWVIYAAIAVGNADASTIIGSHNIFWSNSSPDNVTDITIGIKTADNSQNYNLFSLHLTEADAGAAFSIDSGASFNGAVSLLTNGINDRIINTIENTGSNGSEAFSFFGDNSGANGIDFLGYSIERIDFVINSISINMPGHTGTATLNVISSVPLPGGVLLFGSGIFSLVLAARKRKSAC